MAEAAVFDRDFNLVVTEGAWIVRKWLESPFGGFRSEDWDLAHLSKDGING